MRKAYSVDEDWPETAMDAQALLNNAYWHLRHIGWNNAIEARNILNRMSLLVRSEVSQ